jgi:hypothetical protein
MKKLAVSMLASLLAVAACGDDDDTNGSGGTGGTGGTSATGGAGGRGGSGGSGGSGGAGGTTSTGGSGGSGASGGASGTGGTSSGGSGGSTGGAGGSTGGSGGSTGGSGGSSTDANPSDMGGSETGGGSDGGNASTTFPGVHPQCPNCKSIFDGKTLTGWTVRGGEQYVAQDNTILGTGKGRGAIISNTEWLDYRLVFDYKLIGRVHKANMIVLCASGTTAPDCDGIQFQPPGADTWDYRPGAPNNGRIDAPKEMKVGSANVPDGQWGRCEMLVKGSNGTFRAACCLLGETGTMCKTTESLRFNDGKPAGKGPMAFQAHESNHSIAWRNVFVEDMPAVDDLITNK